MKANKHKPGSYKFGSIVDEVFQDVCDEFRSVEDSGEDIYRKNIAAASVDKWPDEATEKDIREAARKRMEGILIAAGYKRAE